MQQSSTQKKILEIINVGGKLTITPLSSITIFNANEIEEELSLEKVKDEIHTITLNLSRLTNYDSYLIIVSMK
jgi:anti-anti-sigma regulatory factor